MKEFYSLSEAINYHELCPICNTKLQIDDRFLLCSSIDNNVLSFYLSQNEIITINMSTEKIHITTIFKTDMSQYVKEKYYSCPYPLSKTTPPSLSGTFIHGLTLRCNSCCQFSFSIQIYMNLSNVSISELYLNSETIFVEDAGLVHEIKNNYAMECTEYTTCTHSRKNDIKKISLPLIPLNLKHPTETVDRIRKLLIFS